MDKHKGSNMVSNKEAELETDKQNKLKEEQMRVQEHEKKVQDLKEAMDNIMSRSQAAVDDSERIFTELINSMKKRRSEMTELIRAQEKAELSRAERLLKQLEQEIADLKRRVTELEQLSHTHTITSTSSRVSQTSKRISSSSVIVIRNPSFDRVKDSISNLKNKVEEIFHVEFSKISPEAAAALTILRSEPKSRDDFLKYFCYLTLDPNTAHRRLILSEKNRVVTCGETKQRYSDHPERFDCWEQVLCKESVCGRCYWEVEWRGYAVNISVSYKEISRKGKDDECRFGRNSQSWSLQCISSFWHNNIQTVLQGPASSRIGVYVDHNAGILSFYSVSDTMRLIHRIYTTFTRPLYTGFYIWSHSSAVKLCDPK